MLCFPQKWLSPMSRLLFSSSLGLSCVPSVFRLILLCCTCSEDVIFPVPLLHWTFLKNQQRMNLELCLDVIIWSVYATRSIKANWDWLFAVPLLLFFQWVPCQMEVTFVPSCQCWFAAAVCASIKMCWYFLCLCFLGHCGAQRCHRVTNYSGSWLKSVACTLVCGVQCMSVMLEHTEPKRYLTAFVKKPGLGG